LNKGVITPTEEEMAKNGRARSAKMRVGIRK
jgi:16S rRNA C1402 N4-methylase RsmH